MYNILVKSKEFEDVVRKINDNIHQYNVCGADSINAHVGLVPSVVTIRCENDFNKTLSKYDGQSPLYVVPETKIREHVRKVFKQMGTVAFLLSGFPRFDVENSMKHHQNNNVDVYRSFWNVNDIHGTNYHVTEDYERCHETCDGKKTTTHDIKHYEIERGAALLRDEPHVLPRVKSMYNGVKLSLKDYDGNHDLVVRSRSDVRVFDFLDARNGNFCVNDEIVGPLSDDVVYIPRAYYKNDVDIVTDMIAMGNKTVMGHFKNVLNFITIRERDLDIPRIPELILYEYFNAIGVEIVQFDLRYKVMRVVDFGEKGHRCVYLGKLYGTCRIEYVGNSSIVQIVNDNGQYFGHNCGILSFSYTHNHGDDKFVIYKGRIYTTNLDIIFPLHMKENHMIYLSKEHSTKFDMNGPKVPNYRVFKQNTDIVVSRYDENIEWCKPYAEMCVVYNKGEPLKNNFGCKIRHLKNVGRESHTYLSHIVYNWDTLNEYTLFLRGGHIGHGQEKPHMFEGIDVNDYVTIDNDVVMFLSAKQDRKTYKHWLREGVSGRARVVRKDTR